MESLSADLESTNQRESQLDKKQRQFDKALSDAKSKQEDAQLELETAVKETRIAENDSIRVIQWSIQDIGSFKSDIKGAFRVIVNNLLRLKLDRQAFNSIFS